MSDRVADRIPVLAAACLAAFAVVVTPVTPVAAEPARADATPPEAVSKRGEAYAHLMRSVFAAREGDLRRAAGEVRAAIAAQPDSVALHVEGAELMLWMGRRQEAKELADRALAMDPDSATVVRFLGDFHAMEALGGSRPDADSRRRALAHYENLIARDLDDEDVLRRVARLRLQGGDVDGAVAAFERLLARRPGDRSAAISLVRLYLDGAREEEALRAALRYIAKHPEDVGLLQLSTQLANKLEAWGDVVAILGDGEIGDRRATFAHALYGEALLKVGRTAEGTRALELAVKARPGDPGLRYSLARMYREMGRLGDAADEARVLAAEIQTEPDAQVLLGEILTDQGDLGGAIRAFSEALELVVAQARDEDAAYRDAIRRRLVRLMLADDALERIPDVLAGLEEPEGIEGLELRVRAAVAREDWTGVENLTRWLEERDRPALAALHRAEMRIAQRRWDEVEPLVEAALAVGDRFARVQLAAAFVDAGRVERAEAIHRAWVEAEPDNATAHYHYGDFLHSQGRFDAAERHMREAFRLDPRHAPSLNFLGYTLAERGERLEEALRLVQRALEIDATNGAYLDSLGWVYFRMGRVEDALEPLRRAARELPTDPTILDHLGDAYARSGDGEEAVAAWRRALEYGDDEMRGALREKIDATLGETASDVADGQAPDSPR